MTRKLKIVSIFALMTFAILGIASMTMALRYSGLVETKNVKSQEIDSNSEPEKPTQQTLKIEKPTPTLQYNTSSLSVAGWIPTWASDSGFASLQSSSAFDGVSPVWYEVNIDGSLINKFPSNKSSIQNYSNQRNIEFIPTIGMFNHDLLHQVLSNKENRERHVKSIVNEVNTQGYDGIDLDYESISKKDEENYYLFLEQLSTELKNSNKKLVITVLAKWGDDVRYGYRPETRDVQDWSKISKHADQVRIMAYDYTYSGDYYPGPIGPVSWIRDILDYAKTKLPPEKTVLGIHLYAYEWYIPETEGNLEIQPDSSKNQHSNPRTARAYSYYNVENILKNNKGEKTTLEGEKVFVYSAKNSKTGQNERRVLIYIDQSGVEQRMLLARDYGLKGVVFWRLGGQGSLSISK